MLGSALMEHFDARARAFEGDITHLKDVEAAICADIESVVNCAGIVKGRSESDERVWAVNAGAPLAIASVARSRGVKFVHVSTDCVFSGRKGNYREGDSTDAEDLYGRSKAAGEATGPGCLTLRTSFIGRDPRRGRGLLEWLLARNGSVPGHAKVMWSGLSAPELCRAVERALSSNLEGLYHVAGPVISKADLLEVLVSQLDLRGIRVEHVDTPVLDRTLDGSKFSRAAAYQPPSWVEMAKEL